MLIVLKNKDTLELDEHFLKCSIGKKGINHKKKEGEKEQKNDTLLKILI